MNITVLGAGSFGTVLADFLCRKNHSVTLWSHSQDTLTVIAQTGVNSIYMPGLPLCPSLKLSSSLQGACRNADIIVSAIPSQKTREVFSQIAFAKENISAIPKIVCASKGIENETLLLLPDVFKQVIGDFIAPHLFFLSGPSFARELMEQKPTAVTIAGVDKTGLLELQKIFSAPYLRSYTETDVIGVEVGGAVKNVMAIAVGALHEYQFGLNAQAAVITRGLNEMSRLGVKMGAKQRTFMGLSGLGDLVLTATGNLSRNLQVGRQLAQGKNKEQIIDSMRMVAEGITTAKSVYQLAQKLEVDMPISSTVYRVLYEQADIQKEIHLLMNRSLKNEFSS